MIIEEASASTAAVAIVFCRQGADLQLMFIERARHPQDPWSGHMAFPGGRRDADDRSLRHAAERETLEETAVNLEEAEFLGRFDDMHGRFAGRKITMVISSFVYYLDVMPGTRANYEVESILWIPVAKLRDADRRVAYPHPLDNNRLFPGIQVGTRVNHVIWGLTYRFLQALFAAVRSPLPAPLPETEFQ